jgi:uncharacterized protein (DUF2249 family)
MTITATEAYEAMRAHHRTLSTELTGLADAVSSAVEEGESHGTAVAGFIAYLAAEVLPHAVAEEKAIYPAAASRTDLADMLGDMIVEHASLSASGARLAAAPDGVAAARQAQRIAALFAAHAAKENDVLLPALLADESVDLGRLLDEMHAGAARAGTADLISALDAGSAPEDSQATVVALLLQAATALARAGDADKASRIAASAWAALRKDRPDLAVKVTSVLHGLARRAGSQAGQDPAAGQASQDPDLDVRALAPALRHETIFDAFAALLPGTGFVLVNDHDPKPLRYQLEAEHAGEFTWNYLESGPRVWRVRIGRAGA